MNSRVRQCTRLMRVRGIQHDLAAAVAARAVRQVETLELSASKIATLRSGFVAEQGMVPGAVLASLGEIAMRLDVAREDLGKSINGARAQADACQEARLVARRNQESAERLTGKAVTQATRRSERRRSEPRAPRRRLDDEDQQG